ncbi:MAG: aspartate carbamoyltransferase catalytic subunit [Candidatus Tectomicrobia bacterium]|nr:aspartate carbamoyltransferase catalytic subunit [Candidatus Tectomicrobia bacterium]
MTPEPFRRKDLLSIRELSAGEILFLLDQTDSFREVNERDIKKVPTLRGKTIVNLFFEASTRTRASFEIAGKRLSADVINLSASTSSAKKGETLRDTARNIEAMATDVLVVRHSASGAAHYLGRELRCSVVNAGDGCHEHPTQALLDLYTIREHKKDFRGLNVSIVGDIAHSRVARSDIAGLIKLGAGVTICGPSPMLPAEAGCLGARVTTRVEEAIEGADVLIALRIQLERGAGAAFPGNREYATTYGITRKRLRGAKRDILIMHPGPINRGVEMSPDVADGPFSVILEQVGYGVASRMAILYLLAGRKPEEAIPASPPGLEEGSRTPAPVRRTEDALAR